MQSRPFDQEVRQGGEVSYPLTTTLNRIWACNPCDEGKQRALKAAGKNAPDDEPITFQQIVEAVGIEDALWYCRAEPQNSKEWRLFAVWCARQVQHLMSYQGSIDALDVAERFAHGQATNGELDAARSAAWFAAHNPDVMADDGASAATAAAVAVVGDVAGIAAWCAARSASWVDVSAASKVAQQNAFIQLVATGTLPELLRRNA